MAMASEDRFVGHHFAVADDQRPGLLAPQVRPPQKLDQRLPIGDGSRAVGGVARQDAVLDRDVLWAGDGDPQVDLFGLGPCVPTVAVTGKFALLVFAREEAGGQVPVQDREIDALLADRRGDQPVPAFPQDGKEGVEGPPQAHVVEVLARHLQEIADYRLLRGPFANARQRARLPTGAPVVAG